MVLPGQLLQTLSRVAVTVDVLHMSDDDLYRAWHMTDGVTLHPGAPQPADHSSVLQC